MFTFPTGFLAAAAAGGISGNWGSWDGTTNGSAMIYEANTTENVADAERITATVPLDSSRILVFYKDATDTNQEAVVLSLSGKTLTANTPVTVYGTSIGEALNAVLVDTDRVLVTYQKSDSTNDLAAVLLTISTTTITVNAEHVVDTGNASQVALTKLDTDKGIVVYRDTDASSYGYAEVLSISGTTVSSGTRLAFNSAHTLHMDVTQMATDKVMCVYRDLGNSNYGTARVLTVSGTTVTANAATVYESAQANTNRVTLMDTDKLIVTYEDVGNSSYLTGQVLTVSGTTITANTPVVIEETAVKSNQPVSLSTTQAIVVYDDETNDVGKGTILEATGTTVEVGTPVTIEAGEPSGMFASKMDADSAIVNFADIGNTKKGTALIVANA